MDICIVIAFWVMVLVQGGFYLPTFLTATILFAIVCFQKKEKLIYKKAVILVAGVIIVYLATAYSNQATLPNLGRVVYFMGVLLAIVLFPNVSVKEQDRIDDSLLLLGMIEGGIALLHYLGMNLQDVLRNGRFMGTFQYANATAYFICVLLILCLVKERYQKQYGIIFFLTITLIMTYSAGVIVCYLMALGFYWFLQKNRSVLWPILCVGIGGALSIGLYFAKFRMENRALVIILVVLIVALSIYLEKSGEWLYRLCYKLTTLMIVGVLGVVELIVLIHIFGNRVTGTGLERLQQVRDGLTVVAQHPLTGVGTFHVSRALKDVGANYDVALVHNSLLNIGVEGGVMGLVCVLGLVMLVLQYTIKNRKSPLVVLIFLTGLLHFSTDISLFFGGVFYIWLYVLFGSVTNVDSF